MEVDVSYTGNLHCMRNGARGAPGRLEYIPTVAQAPRPAVPEVSPPPRPYEHAPGCPRRSLLLISRRPKLVSNLTAQVVFSDRTASRVVKIEENPRSIPAHQLRSNKRTRLRLPGIHPVKISPAGISLLPDISDDIVLGITVDTSERIDISNVATTIFIRLGFPQQTNQSVIKSVNLRFQREVIPG